MELEEVKLVEPAETAEYRFDKSTDRGKRVEERDESVFTHGFSCNCGEIALFPCGHVFSGVVAKLIDTHHPSIGTG